MSSTISIIEVKLGDHPASRLDKALADVVPEESALSRSRIQNLIESGCVEEVGNGVVRTVKTKPNPGGIWRLKVEASKEIDILPENIPLDIYYEDDDLVVVNKPAGQVVHPAPGAENGTLVNALLYHFKGALSGIGGEKRPGIVHRIDKDTSGLLVIAKSDRAHQGLSAQFAAHSVKRSYKALCWGVPDHADPRLLGLAALQTEPGGIFAIDAPIARHPYDRKKMAVVKQNGRRAVTRLRVIEPYLIASLVECRLETGRTHQIRVHMTHIGHPLLGDPVYGHTRKLSEKTTPIETITAISNFTRQALHAQELGFIHPVSGKNHEFFAEMPTDMQNLCVILAQSVEK